MVLILLSRLCTTERDLTFLHLPSAGEEIWPKQKPCQLWQRKRNFTAQYLPVSTKQSGINIRESAVMRCRKGVEIKVTIREIY